MNRNVSDCDIVLELLPLYIEKKTGQESNVFVESHLTECEACRKVYELMSADWMLEPDAEAARLSGVATVQEEAAFGKKSKKWFRNKMFWVIVGILAYAGLMAGLVVYMFFYLMGM